MSYAPQRPSPTPPSDSKNGNNGHQQPGSGQSPLDWANFMSFPTPPVHQAGPVGNAMRSNSNGGYSNNGQGGNGGQGTMGNNGQQGGKGDDQYNFAQGIALSRPSPNSINFQAPYPRNESGANGNQAQSFDPSQQHQQQQNQAGPSRSPNVNKGKSAARLPDESQQQQQRSQPADNGLTLDPEAFSRDIRFQMPQFLSNQMGGAPTFPPGGEAWSGYNVNLFSSDGPGNQQLTPGTLFGSVFGMGGNEASQYSNEPSGGGKNVLEGLSGFMGDNAWETWDKDTGGNQMATTFYVNPNPSPNVLAQQRSQQAKAQARQANPQISISTSQQPSQSGKTLPSPQISSAISARGTMPSPRSSNASSATAAPSILFGQSDSTANYYIPPPDALATGTQSASTVNIASSSTQPYAPPPNTQALLSGPAMPTNFSGPNLTDGPGLYSTTGFDMVGVLSRVAGRKDPKTVLGPVDLSCSFVVVDIRRYDHPIVYASPTFTALTGYELPQLLGRNCRFLQGPDGEVVKGSKRKYTDNVAVSHLKRMLNAGKECQASLINYRKGGIPFINLVTVVPIPWEGTDIVYHVGFQVDLVEQPNAILRNMRDGSYQVNYTVTNPPQASLRPPGREIASGLDQEILDIMGARINLPTFGHTEEGGKMEWLKTVLDNADDFVHVLSLKGLFQYVSPSVRRVLEYEPEDLLNKNISDICHPSDIVPLMRELKDSTHAPSDGNNARKVNLVFRIRRKSSGYVWIECTGRLHVEPGKGRKAVILSGRARSVPTLPWEVVSRHGGLSDTEAWIKISFEGLILHATTGISTMSGQTSEEVVGSSVFSLLPGGSTSAPLASIDPTSPLALLANAIRSAASGQTTLGANNVSHKIMHRNGAQYDVVSVVYPLRTSDHSSSRSDDLSSPSSDTSRPTSTSSASSSGIKPTSLVIQIKPAQSAKNNRPIVHPATSNLFEELETTRGTSWQYELHQLRLLNRRLKEDISSARARGAKSGKGKKRKLGNGDEMGPPPPPIPEQFSAAPRHQLAPGFGLVPPNMPSPYYS